MTYLKHEQTEVNRQMRESYLGLKQQAAELAEFPEKVDLLLRHIYNKDQEVRYAAVQLLAHLPETAVHYEAVCEGVVTAFEREENPEIHLLLTDAVARLSRGENGKAAFEALKGSVQAEAGIAVRRTCISCLSRVHSAFVDDARLFL